MGRCSAAFAVGIQRTLQRTPLRRCKSGRRRACPVCLRLRFDQRPGQQLVDHRRQAVDIVPGVSRRTSAGFGARKRGRQAAAFVDRGPDAQGHHIDEEACPEANITLEFCIPMARPAVVRVDRACHCPIHEGSSASHAENRQTNATQGLESIHCNGTTMSHVSRG